MPRARPFAGGGVRCGEDDRRQLDAVVADGDADTGDELADVGAHLHAQSAQSRLLLRGADSGCQGAAHAGAAKKERAGGDSGRTSTDCRDDEDACDDHQPALHSR